MSESPYLISGQKRRELKKELSQLKYALKYQHQFNDLSVVYGTYDEEAAKKFNDKTIVKIKAIETMLEQLK